MKQPILNGILENDLDLNGFGFVNFGGLLGTFQEHSAVLDALADTSPSYVGLSLLQLANPVADSFLKIQSNGVPVYVAGSGFESPLTFSPPLVRIGDTISIPAATGSVNGYLTSADWITFNSKATSAQGAKADSAIQSVSIATANGVSGSSSGGTTPALTLVLGAIVPTSVAATGTVTGSNLSGTNTGDQTVPTIAATSTILKGDGAGNAISAGFTMPTSFTAFSVVYAASTVALSSTSTNATTTRKFLAQSGNGTTPTAPTWQVLTTGDIPDLSATYQPFSSNLTSWAAITRASGFDAFTATPSVANFKSLLSDETTVVGNLLSLTNPSAISFIKIAADNTVSTRTPSQLLGDIAAEPALGNPGTSGFVLSSTTGGVRSWVAQTGGITNSAGNNVVPKSNGTNFVASGIDDDGNSINLLPESWPNSAGLHLSGSSGYARLHHNDTTYVSVENGRVNFVADDPPAGGGFIFNTYNVKFGTGGTVQYQGGSLDFAGFGSITGRIGNANLPLGAQLYDNAGTPKLFIDAATGIFYAADGITARADFRHSTGIILYAALRDEDDNAVAGYDDDIAGWYWQSNDGNNVLDNSGFRGNGSGLTNLVGDDTAYDATTWNGNTGVPTKNAIRDKFESLTVASAPALSISGQTGLLTFTGLTSSNRAKTVRDAADTILELGGSYTPTGTWTNLTLVTPALGTPSALVLTNATGSPTGISLTKAQLNTIVSDDDPAYLGAANTFTLNQVNSYSGTASTPAMKYSGVPFAGTGTTSFPLVYLNDSTATASTTLSTSGTYLGVNGHGSANLLNLMLDGASKFKVNSDGTVSAPSYSTDSSGIVTGGGFISNGGTGVILNNGMSRVQSFTDGDIRLCNNASSSFGKLTFGGTTSSFPAIKRSSASFQLRLADDSGWTDLSLGTRDSGTNTITNGLTLGHQSTGTPAAGLGEAILFNLDSSTTADQNAARIAALWTTATHASRTADLVFYTVNNAGALAESARMKADGTFVPAAATRLKVYTVATLPASPTQGDTAAVSDALAPTFLGALTGGSSTYTPVTYTGSAWVSF